MTTGKDTNTIRHRKATNTGSTATTADTEETKEHGYKTGFRSWKPYQQMLFLLGGAATFFTTGFVLGRQSVGDNAVIRAPQDCTVNGQMFQNGSIGLYPIPPASVHQYPEDDSHGLHIYCGDGRLGAKIVPITRNLPEEGTYSVSTNTHTDAFVRTTNPGEVKITLLGTKHLQSTTSFGWKNYFTDFYTNTQRALGLGDRSYVLDRLDTTKQPTHSETNTEIAQTNLRITSESAQPALADNAEASHRVGVIRDQPPLLRDSSANGVTMVRTASGVTEVRRTNIDTSIIQEAAAAEAVTIPEPAEPPQLDAESGADAQQNGEVGPHTARIRVRQVVIGQDF